MLFLFATLLLVVVPTSALEPTLDACDATKESPTDLISLLQSRIQVHDRAETTTTLTTTPAPNELLGKEMAADAEDSSDADWEVEDQDTVTRMESWADSDTTTTVTQATISTMEIDSSDVICGSHRAATCAECPQGHGESWCNGECFWEDNTCKSASITPDNPYGCRPNGQCQARTSSIHFNYQRPSGARTPSWFYNEVKPTSTSSATYFATATTGYGYAGIQTIWKDATRTNDRAVLCSTWDQTWGTAKMEKCGSGVKCKGFGGEGTGAKAMWYFDWTIGKHYAFMMHRKDAGNGRIEHACWFYAEELEGNYSGGWKHIATATSGANQYGSTFKDAGSFLEQWTHENSNEKRQGEYGPAYYKNEDGAWYQSRTTKFSNAYSQERLDAGLVRIDYVSAGLTGGTKRLFMATGGTTQASTPLRRAPRDLAYPEAACGLPTPLYQFEANKKALFQDANVTTSSSVLCGGHRALVCAGCPQGHGMSWCNGECQWKNQQCIMQSESPPCTPQGVSCGNHRADSCADCPGPQFSSAWCNGECSWRQNSCREK